MKFFLVSCVLVAISASTVRALLTQEAMENLRRDQIDCIAESGVSRNIIEYANLDRVIYDDPSTAKFAVCMLKKFNIMTEDGSINQDVYSYNLVSDNPAMFQIAEKCKERFGRDVYETASRVMTCFLNSDVVVIDPYREA